MSLFDQAETNDFYFAIWSPGGNLRKQSTNAPAGLSLPARPEADTRIHTRMRDVYREAVQFTEIGECILAGRRTTADLDALGRFAWWLVAAGAVVLGLGLGGGWWVASRAIRPVDDISAAASRISAGSLSERINVADTDSELGRLAGVLNSTFARLEASFAQQKQFTADASHELRTPIAVLISEAQTALARERTAAEYRETVEGCLDTAQQMRRLTHSLLELARYDAGQEPLERSRFDLAERARSCIELVDPLARERGIQIHSDLLPAETLGDVDRLGQVIINLLTNAIHYNRPNGEIQVRTRLENNAAILTVADTGPGINPEDLPHIFERFYRADKSRARAEGRSGLGLAIGKAIVTAHGGSLEVSSQPGAGSTFTVKLPR
jgi:heavy metal sensor kinase